MFNLSNVPLTDDITKVLMLGTKYIPRYNTNIYNMVDNNDDTIKKSIRLMILKLFFGNDDNNIYNVIPRIANNKWIPDPTDISVQLAMQYERSITSKLHTYITNYRPLRLNDNDIYINNNIAQIKQMDIIVKPADKNVGIVVMDKNTYEQLCYLHLNDTSKYKLIHISNYNVDIIYNTLRLILHKHNMLYMRNTKRYTKLARSLLQLEGSTSLRLGVYYILPKVHKPNVSSRPIVSSISTVTYYTSIYLHNVLNTIKDQLTSVVFSTKHALKKLAQVRDEYVPCSKQYIVLCADVTSLYPSIPTEYGLIAVENILYKLHFDHSQIPLILQLLQWVLTNNYFEFNDDIYLQLTGTAMGTPVAVMYANIVLYYLEQDCLSLPNMLYMRYIDDLCILIEPQYADQLVDIFNSKVHSIKLEAVTKGPTGVFLDMVVDMTSNFPITRVYQKPINRYLYIPPFSNHEKTVFKGWVMAEFLRYRRTCTLSKDYNDISTEFTVRLVNRGYSTNTIFECKNRAEDKYYSELRGDNHTKRTITRPIIILDRYMLQTIPNIKECFTIPEAVYSSPKYQQIYDSNKPLIVTKNGPNMIRHLVKSRYTSSNRIANGVPNNLQPNVTNTKGVIMDTNNILTNRDNGQLIYNNTYTDKYDVKDKMAIVDTPNDILSNKHKLTVNIPRIYNATCNTKEEVNGTIIHNVIRNNTYINDNSIYDTIHNNIQCTSHPKPVRTQIRHPNYPNLGNNIPYNDENKDICNGMDLMNINDKANVTPVDNNGRLLQLLIENNVNKPDALSLDELINLAYS